MKKHKLLICGMLCLAMTAGMLTGCGGAPTMANKDVSGAVTKSDKADAGSIDEKLRDSADVAAPDDADVEIDDADMAEYEEPSEFVDEGAIPLSGSPALMYGITPEHPGYATATGKSAEIDYSNASKGYFMTNWSGDNIRIKVQATGPSGVTYTYDLPANDWTAFPFSDGSGSYLVRVMRNTTGTKYAVAVKTTIDVQLEDAFMPFLTSTQYVDFENAPNAVSKASELCSGKSGNLDKVAAVFDYVVDNVSYDYNLAKNIPSTYIADLDRTMSSKSGICFDYAALMAGMLRSQGVPCKLVVGYAGKAYHAWVSVWVDGEGWVDGVIFFDGTEWTRMDPTYTSTSNRSDAVMQYIGDGSHYTTKYLY